VYAQPTAGSFILKVADQTDAALPGVDVELQIDGQPPRTGVTDPQGELAFTDLPPGRAELVCKLINFATMRRGVVVMPGPMAHITVVMHLSLNADVIVTGQGTFRNIADLENPAENLVGVASAAKPGRHHGTTTRSTTDHAAGRGPRDRPGPDRQSAQR
jgi:Carboxypeptidase regulatory-like domain